MYISDCHEKYKFKLSATQSILWDYTCIHVNLFVTPAVFSNIFTISITPDRVHLLWRWSSSSCNTWKAFTFISPRSVLLHICHLSVHTTAIFIIIIVSESFHVQPLLPMLPTYLFPIFFIRWLRKSSHKLTTHRSWNQLNEFFPKMKGH